MGKPTYMNLFKNYTYTWWQIGVFKLALILLGAAIGVYWNEILSEHLQLIVVVGVVLSLYIGYVSFSQK